MVPGKKYIPEDYLTLAWNHKWLILVCTAAVAVTTFGVVWNLPDRYRAQALIMIVPQRVPEEFVTSTVTSRINERLQMISQTILSRTRLERLIEEFDLYPRERETLIMEDVVVQMRRDVGVNVARTRRREPTTSFTVSYDSTNARTAMLVAQRLASLFVSENLQDRELLADATSQFLEAQLEDARRRLIEHEQKLEIFRRTHAGQLPSQVDSNLQMMNAAQTQLQALVAETGRDRDRLAVLSQALADEAGSAGSSATPAASGEARGGGAPATAAEQLEAARAQVRGLELRLKADHPDLRRAKRIVEELEVKAETEALQRPLSPASPAPGPAATVAERAAASRLGQMKVEATQIEARLDSRKLEQAQLEGQIATYRARLEAAPARESELVELMRDYSTLQDGYASLLRKNEESRISVNLERRQVGEQFRVLDNPQLPQRPISPNRPRLYVMGLLGGLALGLGLTALLEYRDTTLKTDSDVIASLSLTVLAVIPAMITREERASAKRRVVLAGVAGSLAGVAVAAALVWQLGLLDRWVR